MNRRYWMIPAILAMAFVMTLATPAQAEEGPNLGRVSLSIGSDFVTGYYFRGISQEPNGVIWQPSVEVGFLVSEGDGPVSDLSLVGGIWSSMHDESTGSASGPGIWYEADIYAGVSFSLTDNLGATALYTAYTSPNGAFSSVNEVSVELAYDDSGFWAGRDAISLAGFEGFQPYVVIAFEIDDQADGGNGDAAGFNEGVYLECGIAPSTTLVDSETSPITLTVPVVLGVSLEDYYEFTDAAGAQQDDDFGYLKLGVTLSMPIAGISSDYGAWEAYAGVDFLFLGDSTRLPNSGRDDSGFEVIGSFGIAMNY